MLLMNVCATGLQNVCRLRYFDFDSTNTLIQQQLLNDYVQPETAGFGLVELYVGKHAIMNNCVTVHLSVCTLC